MTTYTAVGSRMTSDPDTDAGWSAVIVDDDDDDVPAGQHAPHTFDTVVHVVGEKFKQCPLPRRFDILEDPDRRAEAAIDSLRADLLIISTRSKGDLPAVVEDWVRTGLSQKRGHAAVVVALLGPVDDTDSPDSSRVEFLRNVAEEAKLGFSMNAYDHGGLNE